MNGAIRGGHDISIQHDAAAHLGVLVLVLGLVMLAGPTQAAVPPATGNNAVITVKVGDARTGLTSVGDLAGVVLGFYTAATGGTLAFSCTSDADGDCSVIVPNTQVGGANRDLDLWIRQVSAPSGWYMNQAVGVGTTVGTPTPYTITGPDQLRNGETYTSLVNFMIGTGTTNNAASSGVWQNSRTNPSVPQQCGIDVALLLDLSNSVTDAQLVQLKAAARTFVNSLVGTPSRIAIFTFATSAPATAGDTLTLTPVSTQAAADTVNTHINALAKPGGNAGGTNWDRGVYQIAQSPSLFDEAIVITDGNPTFYGNGDGPGNRTRFRELENGIFSANAVKAEGTRVVAVGVGDGVGSAGSGANLRSISGTTLNSDYFQTEDYAEAGQQLRNLALGACQGSITVVKQVIPPGGTVAQAQPADGWEFTGQGTAGAVVVDAPVTRTTATGTGAANFPLTFPGGSTSGNVTMTETPQSGFTLEPVNGSNATCVNLTTGAAVPSTNVTNGFTVAANLDYPISCRVYNRSPLATSSVVLSKTWTIDGTDYTHANRPDGFQAEALIDATNQPWDVPRTGYFQGDVVQLDERNVVLPTLCTLDSQRLTLANGATVDLPLPSGQTLNPGLNAYGITNVVTCDTLLTLLKQVDNGSAQPEDWTLDAVAPDGALAGPNGTTGVTAAVTPDVTYPLAESDGDPNYVQGLDPNAVLIPGSTGSWSCIPLDADGNPAGQPFDGLNGGVTVPLGVWAQCTASNATATLTLVKEVENTAGGTAVPGDWDLTATPIDPPEGVVAQTVNGADSVVFDVRPGVTYELSESDGPAGYVNTTIICDNDLERTLVEEITLEAGDSVTCTFTNVDSPATLTLVKEVVNDDGGTALPGDWTLSADGPTPVSGAGNSDEVTDQPVSAGDYDLSEAGGPAGYTPGDWECEGGTIEGATLALGLGDDVTCTIVNDDQPAQLTLVKEVVNDDGGTAIPGDWTLTADGPTPISGAGNSAEVTEQTVDAGSYELSEAGGPAGYTPSDWTCEGGTIEGSTLTLAAGEAAICTIVNDDLAGPWTVEKASDPVSGSTVQPGDVITYTVTATKLDGRDPTDLVVRDDLSQVLDNATLVPGSIEASIGTASVGGTTLTWEIPVLSGSETVTYQVRVNDDAWGVELTNLVTGDGAEPCVPGDETPMLLLAAADADEECDSTHHYTPAWTLEKSSDPVSGSEVEAGDVIAYTLTAENISNAVLDGAVVEDDLSEVLAHAELLAVPDGAELDGTTLIWQVPTLQPGESAALTYEVRVDDDAEDVTLVNVAVPGPGGECVTSCSTDHDVPPVPPVPTLPGTGVTVFWTIVLGLLLIGGGTALVAARRRQS